MGGRGGLKQPYGRFYRPGLNYIRNFQESEKSRKNLKKLRKKRFSIMIRDRFLGILDSRTVRFHPYPSQTSIRAIFRSRESKNSFDSHTGDFSVKGEQKSICQGESHQVVSS